MTRYPLFLIRNDGNAILLGFLSRETIKLDSITYSLANPCIYRCVPVVQHVSRSTISIRGQQRA